MDNAHCRPRKSSKAHILYTAGDHSVNHSVLFNLRKTTDIPPTHKRNTHAVDLDLRYLRLPAITLTSSTRFSSPLSVSLSPPPPSSPVLFNYHLALRGVLKEALGVLPSLLPFKLGDINILYKSDVPLTVTEEKLMTEGCDGRGGNGAGRES